jgi:hypothetical protein
MTGYTQDFRKQHEAEIAAEEKRLKEQKRANDAARKKYLEKLEAERRAERDRHDADVERQLAPAKERARRQWCYDHPGTSDDDFEEHWPLRQNHIENDVAAQLGSRRDGS